MKPHFRSIERARAPPRDRQRATHRIARFAAGVLNRLAQRVPRTRRHDSDRHLRVNLLSILAFAQPLKQLRHGPVPPHGDDAVVQTRVELSRDVRRLSSRLRRPRRALDVRRLQHRARLRLPYLRPLASSASRIHDHQHPPPSLPRRPARVRVVEPARLRAPRPRLVRHRRRRARRLVRLQPSRASLARRYSRESASPRDRRHRQRPRVVVVVFISMPMPTTSTPNLDAHDVLDAHDARPVAQNQRRAPAPGRRDARDRVDGRHRRSRGAHCRDSRLSHALYERIVRTDVPL